MIWATSQPSSSLSISVKECTQSEKQVEQSSSPPSLALKLPSVSASYRKTSFFDDVKEKRKITMRPRDDEFDYTVVFEAVPLGFEIHPCANNRNACVGKTLNEFSQENVYKGNIGLLFLYNFLQRRKLKTFLLENIGWDLNHRVSLVRSLVLRSDTKVFTEILGGKHEKIKQTCFFSHHLAQSWLYANKYYRYEFNQDIQNDLQILENIMRTSLWSTNVDQMIFHHVKWKHHFPRNGEFARKIEQTPKYVEITATIQGEMTFEVVL